MRFSQYKLYFSLSARIIEKYPMHTDELMKIKGEMLFNRALCHFDLSRVFGQAL